MPAKHFRLLRPRTRNRVYSTGDQTFGAYLFCPQAHPRHRRRRLPRLAPDRPAARARRRRAVRRQSVHRHASAISRTTGATRASSSCATTSPSRCTSRSTRSTISPARPRRSTTSTIRCRRPRPRSTARSTCSAWPSGSARGSSRPRPARSMAIPRVHPQTEDYWGNVNPIGIRVLLRRGQALRRDPVLRLSPPARARHQGRADLQHLRPAHAPQRRARGLQFHRPGAEGRADHHLRRRQADAVLLLCRRPDRRADRA